MFYFFKDFIFEKLVYKLKFGKIWRIYNDFLILLLKSNNIKQKQVDKIILQSKFKSDTNYKII